MIYSYLSSTWMQNILEKRGAQIHDVCLLDENHHALAWIVGGEKVILRVMVHAHQYLSSPIIGFFVKNDLGQNLFGDNTYLSYNEKSIYCDEGQELQANFCFLYAFASVWSLQYHGCYS